MDGLRGLKWAAEIMYTCDAFGMHYCTTDVYDEQLDALVPHYRFYYDCLMKPNSRSVLTALRKVRPTQPEPVACADGPWRPVPRASLPCPFFSGS